MDQPKPKPITINPALKFFFFKGFKSQRTYKTLEAKAGKVETMSIIITQEKMFMRAKTPTGNVDSPFTTEEMNTFLKGINIKPETVKGCKNIFITMNMTKHTIVYQQTKLDGEKSSFTI